MSAFSPESNHVPRLANVIIPKTTFQNWFDHTHQLNAPLEPSRSQLPEFARLTTNLLLDSKRLKVSPSLQFDGKPAARVRFKIKRGLKSMLPTPYRSIKIWQTWLLLTLRGYLEDSLLILAWFSSLLVFLVLVFVLIIGVQFLLQILHSTPIDPASLIILLVPALHLPSVLQFSSLRQIDLRTIGR